MIDTPAIVQSTPQRTAAIHVTVPRGELQNVFPPAVSELLAALDEQGVNVTGPLYSYHLQLPGEVFDLDIGFPVAREVKASGRVFGAELPAMKVARTVYRGPLEGLGGAWEELRAWIGENGITAKPFLWENYQVGPGDTPDPAAWKTELNWPLAD